MVHGICYYIYFADGAIRSIFKREARAMGHIVWNTETAMNTITFNVHENFQSQTSSRHLLSISTTMSHGRQRLNGSDWKWDNRATSHGGSSGSH